MARTALVIPGASFGPHTATLAFPRFAAEARGAEIRVASWDDDEARALPEDARRAWVEERIRPLLGADRPVLIGRSLGCYAAGLAAEHRLSAIWISPVLTSPEVPADLARASAPTLLVGGTADPMWDADAAHDLPVRVVEIDGANHGIHRAGPLAASTAALGELVTAVESFLDEEVWPEPLP